MPLTPVEVANKQFRVAFRGYAVDEVDAFLDEVESELARLLTAAAGVPAAPGKGAPGRDAPAAPLATTAGPVPSATSSPEATPAPSSSGGTAGLEGQEAALRTLLLAQRTADQAIAEAREEAEQLVAAAREQAAARLGEAREQAAAAVTAAREEAESTLAASRAEAGRLDEEIAQRRQVALGELERRQQRLASDIAELQAFEREYRTRLRAYLQGQLRELDGQGGGDDSGVGVPIGASGAAVGRPPGGAVRIGSAGAGGAEPAGEGPAGRPAPADATSAAAPLPTVALDPSPSPADD